MKLTRVCAPGRPVLAAVALLTLTLSSHALEPRLWISLEGSAIDAELVKVVGDTVELKDKDGRIIKVPKAKLSFGDLDYIEEFAPAEKSKSLTPAAPAKVRIPEPAKEVKLNTKTFKKDAGTFPLLEEGDAFKVMETPHFKVLYTRAFDPGDVAEQAERLWFDLAFFHSSFAGKWKDRRKVIILADDTQYQNVGKWYATNLKNAGRNDYAEKVSATWPKSAANEVVLPADMANSQGVFPDATILRLAAKGPQGSDNGKGVWTPFRTHVIAGDLLGVQAGGVSGFAKEGQFAIFTGFSFYKEISLTGKCATGLVTRDSDNQTGSASGYANVRSWPGELKKRIRGKEVKPSLAALYVGDSSTAKPDDIALVYAFSRYLQSTPKRLSAFNKLIEQISISHQVPDGNGLAKIYGFENSEALEKDWKAWMDSGDFR
ncbi:MAG: hypothetical protein EOP86_17390 [Verrucomicrobiaceae bacterium]|nr:MAG: hypothetical protein EOP86_17390 [Verrucomicrobiaceae bacterium]